ncbi:MAG: 16S rRNA (cytidine(1402)-2'-O)-methyltransferase [Chromatiales bacterium]|nr:MAG: 16S rRNA (cytidine(1402)-2'-O)-methyltransferase [Chromatiales bacterium]
MSVAPGTLYVVATPIGNLDDLSPRARRILETVAVVACEDTRRTGQLLTRLGVQQTLLSLHEHNETRRVGELLEKLRGGQDVALVSDAGTPLVSDPGYRLLAALREAQLPVCPVPGPSAVIAALSVAGLPSDRFHFEGFLPPKAAARRRRLQIIAAYPQTLVFYEAVHRIDECLADLADILGPHRPATLCRELTKRHETIQRGTLAELRELRRSDEGADRGELTLVVGGQLADRGPADAELERIFGLLVQELPPGRAAALAARITGAKRADAYRLARLPDPE